MMFHICQFCCSALSIGCCLQIIIITRDYIGAAGLLYDYGVAKSDVFKKVVVPHDVTTDGMVKGVNVTIPAVALCMPEALKTPLSDTAANATYLM